MSWFDDNGFTPGPSVPGPPVDPNDPSHGAEPGGFTGAPYQQNPALPGGEIGPDGTFVPAAAPSTPAQAAAPTPSANAGNTIYHPDQGGIFGFDTSKLQDPNKSDAKYTPAAKAFSGALGAGVQISRGGLDSMVQYLQQNGFGNARAAGEDKIDFGDGAGPIDVLANQGGKDLITFQNNRGNAQWEAQNGGGTGQPAAASGPAAITGTLGSVSTSVGPAATPQPATQFSPVTYTPFSYGSFVAPTPDSVQSDPGYKFGLDQGLKAQQANTAARGVLRTGGAEKGLTAFANDYATTKFDDAYQRALSTFNTNYGTAFQTNQANNAGSLGAFGANTNAALGYGGLDNTRAQIANEYALGAGNIGLGYYNASTTRDLGMANVGLGYHQADQNFNLGMANVGLGYGNLGLGYYNAGNQNALNWGYYGLGAQGQDFNQQYSLASLGANAVSGTNNAAGNYGAAAGGLITGAGNAGAAGRVGSANAYNGALGAAGNAALGAYGLYTYGQRPTAQRPGVGGTPTYA